MDIGGDGVIDAVLKSVIILVLGMTVLYEMKDSTMVNDLVDRGLKMVRLRG